MARKSPAAFSFDTILLEGALFLPDTLAKVGLGNHQETQAQDSYIKVKGLSIQDEIGRAFRIALAQAKAFADSRQRADRPRAAEDFAREFLRDTLGYADLSASLDTRLGDRTFPVRHFVAGRVPVVIAHQSHDLDDPRAEYAIAADGAQGARKRSPFQLAQEFLNASEAHTWALVTNGDRLRLLRDTPTLTRPAFLEFDLRTILAESRYAEFAVLWRILHASRAGLAGTPGSACIWERWRDLGLEEGARVRDGLRDGVTDALRRLGTGFLKNPANEPLRAALQDGSLSKKAFFNELLRLIYRQIFLFTVEERGLLHTPGDAPELLAARRAYAAGYSLARLRDRSRRRAGTDPHGDLWQGLRIVFRGLHHGQPRLALPALGGLFAADQCPHLDAAELDNGSLLAAVFRLRWANRDGALAPIDYRNMGSEELGSVYESLLELVPEVHPDSRTFSFVGLDDAGSTAGNSRKTTGSYYTPDCLVQELIKTALDPVIEAKVRDNPENPAGALLAMRVIDPACGSGHFLLAAARRLAERLAALRSPEGAVRPEDYRRALREVIAHCIYGVDLNPMAVELARTALWLEGFAENLPLSFLDAHLRVGDALLGLIDLSQLDAGIPEDAYAVLSGDDKQVCKELKATNKAALKERAKRKQTRELALTGDATDFAAEAARIDALPDDNVAAVEAKRQAQHALDAQAHDARFAHAADLFVGTFLIPKTDAGRVPTTAALDFELHPGELDLAGPDARESHTRRLDEARRVCDEARVFHWPLEFPKVFADGGFDCVLANPPWERIKLQEEEFFATRHTDIANAKNKAERATRLAWLRDGVLSHHLFPELPKNPVTAAAERALYTEFLAARRTAEAVSAYAHVDGKDGGRYPLTGVGDVNTYALFAESITRLTAPAGRAGFITPSGIATDDTTKAYFAFIAGHRRLTHLYSFENEEFVFPSVHHSFRFTLLTIAGSAQPAAAELLCQARNIEYLADTRRRFSLTPEDLILINPNTRTCPVFRSQADAELTRKIYSRVPVLIREERDDAPESNPWGMSFMMMFHMANDSHLFLNAQAEESLPLYEAKMIHHFDHRWATYSKSSTGKDEADNASIEAKQNPAIAVTPRYWLKRSDVVERLASKSWTRPWLMGWRDICRATDERTVIASVMPIAAVGDTLLLMFPSTAHGARIACLLGDQISLVHDYAARQKIGGTHLKNHVKKQLPILPPETYTESELRFIVPRVLELTYTAHDMAGWAQDIWDSANEGLRTAIRTQAVAAGLAAPVSGLTTPFAFNPDRRARLRAELDATYARLYGLTRDDLRYILDPTDLLGPDYPSETFRVLKNRELKEFGEYRTQRLVLEAWDRLAAQSTAAPAAPPIAFARPAPGWLDRAFVAPNRARDAAIKETRYAEHWLHAVLDMAPEGLSLDQILNGFRTLRSRESRTKLAEANGAEGKKWAKGFTQQPILADILSALLPCAQNGEIHVRNRNGELIITKSPEWNLSAVPDWTKADAEIALRAVMEAGWQTDADSAEDTREVIEFTRRLTALAVAG